MKNLKLRKRNLLYILLACVLLTSCSDWNDKQGRESELEYMFPKAEIIEFEDKDLDSGWTYIVNDTINDRVILAITYRNNVRLIDLPINAR